jgi:hypothetical protein
MKALIVDNIDFPKGLTLRMHSDDSRIMIAMNSSAKVETLLGTLDEILEHASTAEKVIY